MATVDITSDNFETYFTEAMKKYSESLEKGAESEVVAFITAESAITNTMSLPGVEFNKKPVKDDGTVDPSATINRYIQIPWSVLSEVLAKMKTATQAAGYVNAELNTETNILTVTDNKGTQKTANVKGATGSKGDKGDTGATPQFSIGSVQSGQTAAASIGGTTLNPTLNLTLPKGDTGSQGPAGSAATVDVDGVATGAPGTNAKVENRGSQSAARFFFTIPQGTKGDTGAKGDQGIQGPKGEKGDTPVIRADEEGNITSDGVVVSTAIKDAMDTFNANESARQTTFEDNEQARQQTFEDNEDERMATMLLTRPVVDTDPASPTFMCLLFIQPQQDKTKYEVLQGCLNITVQYEQQ